MCTPISAWAPISCDDEDLQNWRCRTAGPRGMNQPEDKRQKPQIITSPNSRDDPLRIQPARCYHSAQTRPAPKAIQTRIEKSRELPPGGERGRAAEWPLYADRIYHKFAKNSWPQTVPFCSERSQPEKFLDNVKTEKNPFLVLRHEKILTTKHPETQKGLWRQLKGKRF